MESYIVQNKYFETRINSRSGGMFTAVSDLILNQNGTVYGAKLNADMTVSHSRATTKEERNLFRGVSQVRGNSAVSAAQMQFQSLPCARGGGPQQRWRGCSDEGQSLSQPCG